jgi:glucose-6-phosphate 1-dehydrogenase
VWNRRYIDHVQITAAESIGIESRGAFYEQTGAIRDLISTHLFQMTTFLAMEPPVSFEPDRLRDETVKVLRSARACDTEHLVRGQYGGYREEAGVADDSNVETFAALRLEIDNWRWSDVPFYLRTGKRLAAKATEITLKFRKVPFNVFEGSEVRAVPKRDHLTIRIQPDEGISLAFQAKVPGPGYAVQTVRMDFDYDRSFDHATAEAYERLIHDAMDGDHTLFTREDDVERSWEIVSPALADPGPVHLYAEGSWGPSAADELIAPAHWHLGGHP